MFGEFGEAVIVYGLVMYVGIVNVIQFTAPPVQSAAVQIVYVLGPQRLEIPFKT